MPKLEAMPGTDQWIAARVGKLTASRMKDVLAKGRGGKGYGEARHTYMAELVTERRYGMAMDHVVTDAMQHGIDTEPAAAEAFEEETGILCLPAGFYLHDTIEHFGASPDRLIGDDELLEIKCPSPKKFTQWQLAGVVPDEHKPQMMAQLCVMRRRACWFCAYDPRVIRGSKLLIRKYEPTAEEIKTCEDEARTFLQEVEKAFDLICGQAA